MSIRPVRENHGYRAPAVARMGALPPPPAVRMGRSADPRMTEAIRGLWLRRPDLSARGPVPRWLLPAALLVVGLGTFAFLVEPAWTIFAAGGLLIVPFAGATFLRLAAAAEVLRRPTTDVRRTAGPAADPSTLPLYSVLVPLYDEADVLPRLVLGLSRLDYPPERLEVLLILEARDAATRQAAALLSLPSNMHVVVVPKGGPRTKPKALNYALTFSTADLVVVFDAEDRPGPGQLRAAAAAFSAAGAGLACVQARLNVYNPGRSFFTRQFALEYSALFDGLLPALERLGLPIPLGGTSNHFRMSALRAAGAWDPYNVTEDADLGIRLARMGYRTATLASTTWEEAPENYRVWLGQRTRWLKGWLQTWLVHMRRPWRLLRELGPWQFVGLQLVMGGVLLSALVHPIVIVMVFWAWLSGELWLQPEEEVARWLWSIGLANLGIGVLAPAIVAAVAVVRRGRSWLLPWVLLMPVYWLAISVAGYRAVIELARRPYHWEKTRHGLHSAAEKNSRPGTGSWRVREVRARRRKIDPRS